MKIESVFHGTDAIFKKFDDNHMLDGNQMYGPGFYFTSEKSIAEKYTSCNNIIIASIIMNKPIEITITDEDRNPFISACKQITIPSEKAYQILSQVKSMKIQPNNTCEINPIGDYLDCFWKKDHYTDIEFNQLVKLLINELKNQNDNISLFTIIDILYSDFLEIRWTITKTLGYDGVIVNLIDKSKIYVTWYADNVKEVL